MTTSTCSAAVGVLSLIAAVHILLSIVLGALIVVVCYHGKKRGEKQLAKKEDSLARERSRALEEIESPDRLYLSSPEKPTKATLVTNEASSEQNIQELENLGQLGDNLVTMETEDVKPISPEATEPVRKRSRLSVISNISNRFRKSVDLDSEEVVRLVRETSSSERESSERDTTEESTMAISFSVGDAPSVDKETVIKNTGAIDVQTTETIQLADVTTSRDESEC